MAAKQLQKVMHAQRSPPRPAGQGPLTRRAGSWLSHYERERVSPSLTSPGTLQEPAGFTGERIQTHSPPGGSGHGAPVAPIGGQGPLPWA